MADFLSQATVKGDPWVEARQCCAGIKDLFPCLYDVLVGSPPNGAGISRFPGSVRLFTNAGELKACLSGKEWLYDGYVVIPQGDTVLEGLEKQLKAGKIGWSPAREQKDSWKKPTH